MKKTCRDCGADLPADLYHFHRNASHKDGLSSYCHECDLARGRRRWREKDPPSIRFPIIAPPLRRPPSGIGTGENVCLRCSDLAECTVLAQHDRPVKCEARDTWDALREASVRVSRRARA